MTMFRPLFRFALCCALPFASAAAQADTSARTPEDSVILRARQMGQEGREGDGRKLVDSLVKASSPDNAIYGEALYWRGFLAPTAADAERDYRRLLIEAPLHPRAEDALLQLAQLLQARGDRRGASDYLQRFMLTYADSPQRPRVALSLVRLLFDQGPQMIARACEALRTGREAIPQESLELRNQLEFYAPRCDGVAVAAAPVPVDTASTPAAAPAPAETTAVKSPRPAKSKETKAEPKAEPKAEAKSQRADAKSAPKATKTTAPEPKSEPRETKTAKAEKSGEKAAEKSKASSDELSSFYSVQIAAYDSPEPARKLASTLQERGVEARVDGVVRPFRVRVGKMPTRADAVRLAAALKGQGYNGFITLVKAESKER